MKKIFYLVLLLSALIVSLVAQGPVDKPPAGTHYDINFVTRPKFVDTFDGDLSQWTHISGTWAIIQEGLNNVCSITGGSYVGGVVATAGSEFWTDYSLEFDVKKESGNYFNVVFRYTDGGNHYLFEPSADTIHIALFKKVGSGSYQELTTTRPLQDTNIGTWYHYKIVVQGPSIKIYVNNILKFDVTDFDLPEGKIGIGGYLGSTAYFDNITVMKPNEILIAENGTVPGLQYLCGNEFAILDHDAGVIDGDRALLQLPETAIYDVYCSARGKPGGWITWGSIHQRVEVPAGKPTWHQHVPDNFSLFNYYCGLGPYGITTANDAAILATRWYPQN